jgi:L-alanine-DL-glutamate epimerase-like enolase superfamily enzyme
MSNGVQRVRETVGPGVTLTVDFNQACSPKEAIERLQKMDPYDVALVEQPVNAHDLRGMALVRKAVRPLVMADDPCSGNHRGLFVPTGRARFGC